MSPSLTVGVTGAQGYVGSVIGRALSAVGIGVVPLVRTAPPNGAGTGGDGPASRHYDLSEAPGTGLLEGLDVLVHCAWDMRLTRYADIWRVNVEGTNRLVAMAKQAGTARVVFISSMSAYGGTSQIYGLTKLACERVVLASGGAVLRPGLVYGTGAGGMIGNLGKLSRFPVVPVIARRGAQFMVHEDDLAASVLKLVTSDEVPAVPLGLAHPDPVPFEYILRATTSQDGKRRRYVSVPWPAVYIGLRAGEAVGLRLPFRSDSLLGLIRPAPSVANADVVRAMGLRLRPFPR
jgi:nucleoside-diphosphate-sugar epimerase